MQGFSRLFRVLVERVEALLADKGYNADTISAELVKADAKAVNPASETAPRPSRTIAKNTAGEILSSARPTSSGLLIFIANV